MFILLLKCTNSNFGVSSHEYSTINYMLKFYIRKQEVLYMDTLKKYDDFQDFRDGVMRYIHT